MEYRYGSHTIYNIEYHFVWVTKYRYKALVGEIGLSVRQLVSAPPNMAPSEIMRRIKGRPSSKLFEEFTHLKKRYWGRHFWARRYFCCTVG